MEEPTNIDHYWLELGTIEVNGKKGYGKVKKWYDEDEKKYKERVISFDAYAYEDAKDGS